MKEVLRIEKKYILLLLLLFTLSQGLILIISGLWYDDWCIINISNKGLKTWASEMGRPEVYPIFLFITLVPEIIYKILIFSCYFVITITFYLIVKKLFQLDSPDSFFLTLLFLSVPVNDIRIERLGLPYTLGLFLFSLAFCILIYYYDDLTIKRRILVLILFFFSYILNSLLVFMGLVWMFIFYKERKIKKIFRKIDFIVLPFMFYTIKNLFFHAHGLYDEYNKVNAEKLFIAVRDVVKDENSIAKQILEVYFEPIIKHPALFCAIFCITAVVFHRVGINRSSELDYDIRDNNIIMQIREGAIGFAALFAGLFAYTVVGKGGNAIAGFNGRNAILVPYGFALIIYTLLTISMKSSFRYATILIIYIVSTLHFQRCYADYQSIYYSDRGFQEYLKVNNELEESKIIVVIEEDKDASFYMYNGIFEEVYGDESRLVLNYINNSSVDTTFYDCYIEREWYNMTGFDSSYKKIDCIILFSHDFDRKRAIITRIYEIFGEDIRERLLDRTSFRIIYSDDEEFDYYVTQ